MSMAVGSKLQLEPGSWAETAYDVCIGIAVGAAHSFYFVTRWWFPRVFHPILRVFGLKLNEQDADTNKEKILKVVAVGYGRTGTVRRLIFAVCLNAEHEKFDFSGSCRPARHGCPFRQFVPYFLSHNRLFLILW